MSRLSRRAIARLALLAFLIAAFAVVWLSPLREHLDREHVRTVVESVRGAWYGPLLLIAMYAVGCVFAIPASLFILAAGAIWGWLLGGTYAMVGGILGAMASFFVGRFLGDREGRARTSLEARLRDASFGSLLVLRLLPVFPFAVLNYAAGVVRVNTLAFFASTLLGLVPSNFVFAWSADEIFNGTLSGGAVFARLFTVAAVCLAAVAIPALAARALRRRQGRREATRDES